MRSPILGFPVVGIALLLLCNNSALAEDIWTFQDLGTNTIATDINDRGQIVGWHPFGPYYPTSFLYDGNTFTSIEYPGSYYTVLNGINNAGQVVGLQGSPPPPGGLAFLKDGNAFTSFNYPGAIFTYANGINDPGVIVGKYRVEIAVGPNSFQDFDHGLIINGNTLTSFDVPGARDTVLQGINDAGKIVGYSDYTTVDGTFHAQGFLKDGNTFTSIDVPGATYTEAFGINDRGQIVGLYYDATGTHGFLDSKGTFTTIDVPGATYTEALGINDRGQIVGRYEDATGTHGFLASVPEPSSILLLGLSIAGVLGWQWKQLGRARS